MSRSITCIEINETRINIVDNTNPESNVNYKVEVDTSSDGIDEIVLVITTDE